MSNIHDYATFAEVSGTTFGVTPMSVELDYAQALAVSTLAVFASTDSITPVIGGIRLELQRYADDHWHVDAWSTDRYVAAHMSFDLPIEAADADDYDRAAYTIPASEFAAFTKSAPKNAPVQIRGLRFQGEESRGGFLRFSSGGTVRETREVYGNYPPLEKLFKDGEEPIPAGIMLLPSYLAKLAKVRLGGDTPVQAGKVPWSFSAQPYQTHTFSDGRVKHGPILATREDAGVTVRVLIQPHLKLR